MNRKTTARSLAKEYLRLGIKVFPGVFKTKTPAIKKWNKKIIDDNNVDAFFQGKQNILGRNGAVSGNLIDIDIDSQEACRIKARYLPDTPFVTGRESSPGSHFYYRTCETQKSVKYRASSDSDIQTQSDHGDLLLELRADGTYTALPGSIHPSGEPYSFYANNKATGFSPPPIAIPTVDGRELRLSCQRLAAAAMMAREMHQGGRNELIMALAGSLLHQQAEPGFVKHFCESVSLAADDEEIESREKTVETTIEKFQAGQEVTGVPTLRNLVGEGIVDKLFEWLQLARSNRTSKLGQDSDKGSVDLDEDLDKQIDALSENFHSRNNPPRVFRMGVQVVTVSTFNGQSETRTVDLDRFREEVARRIVFHKTVEQRGVITKRIVEPSRDLLASAAKSDSFRNGLPCLDGLTPVPVFTPSGDIQLRPGYDERTKRILTTAAYEHLETVPPSSKDAQRARDYIVDLFGDFPFDSDASLANALAALITPMLGPLINATTPLFVIDAGAPGTGKSTLARAIISCHTNHYEDLDYPVGDEAERRKLILSVLRGGATFVLFDNVRCPMNSSALDKVLTSRLSSGRILGVSETQSCLNNATWLATSNNAEIGGDLAKRCALIGLEATIEDLNHRSFKHPNLTEFIENNRFQIVTALITIIQYWVGKGMPPGQAGKHRMSNWSTTVGGVLEALKIHGFLDNSHLLSDEYDEDQQNAVSFFRIWWETYGDDEVFASHLIGLAYDGPEDEFGPLFTEAIALKDDKTKAKILSHWLRKHLRRIIDGKKIIRIAERRSGNRFKLIGVSGGDDGK